LSNGTIPESTVYVFAGVIGIIIIFGIILGVILQLSTLKSKAKAEAQKVTDQAVAEATKETESKIAFKALTKSVDAMNDTVSKLSKGVGDQISTIQKELITICGRVDLNEASARSAHKRIDEHRKIEHGIPIYRNNNHFAGEEEKLIEDQKG